MVMRNSQQLRSNYVSPKTALTPCRNDLERSALEGDSPLRIRGANSAGRARVLKLDANSLALGDTYRKVAHAVATNQSAEYL